MTTELKDKQTREFGLTVMVNPDGKIEITPHNLINDFEFVGLVEYLVQKKSDVLKTLGVSLEYRNLLATGEMAKIMKIAITNNAEQTEDSTP